MKFAKDNKRKRSANEFIRTSLANSGRIAGIGISYDDYSDNFDIAMENTDYFPNPKFGAPPLSEEEQDFRDNGGPVKIYKLKEGEIMNITSQFTRITNS